MIKDQQSCDGSALKSKVPRCDISRRSRSGTEGRDEMTTPCDREIRATWIVLLAIAIVAFVV
jgi:hypothetical protein